MLIQSIKAFALLGGGWVLYLLFALSLLSVAVILNRIFYFSRYSRGSESLGGELTNLLAKGRLSVAEKLLDRVQCPEARILRAGLSCFSQGREVMEQVLESQRLLEKMEMERYLLVLGTLGNNAPFIGLLGTVLGIIRAFNDLALAGTSGSRVVMQGVSEALVATAVGLFIAIPAVIFFNYFQGRIKRTLSNADRLSHLLLVHARSRRK